MLHEDTQKVYQAIKDINSEGKLAQMGVLSRETGLSMDDIVIALKELDSESLIKHDSIVSTGKDDYGEYNTFSDIKAV